MEKACTSFCSVSTLHGQDILRSQEIPGHILSGEVKPGKAGPKISAEIQQIQYSAMRAGMRRVVCGRQVGAGVGAYLPQVSGSKRVQASYHRSLRQSHGDLASRTPPKASMQKTRKPWSSPRTPTGSLHPREYFHSMISRNV